MICKKCSLVVKGTRCIPCRKYKRMLSKSCSRCGRKCLTNSKYKTCEICRNSKNRFNISDIIIKKHDNSKYYLVH